MNNPQTAASLPRTVVARKLAARDQCLGGSVDVGTLPRMTAAVLGASLPIEVELQFTVGDDGVCEIHGKIAARVTMTCERCLEPFELALSARPALGLAGNEADAERLPRRLEPCLTDGEELDLFDLVEEELLLALPIIATHADGSCLTQPADTAADQSDSPFRVLAQLKSRHSNTR